MDQDVTKLILLLPLWVLLLSLWMHRISGSGLHNVRPFLISGSGSKLPDSEPESLLITACCFVIFQTFSVFQHWTYSTRIVSLSSINVFVWWFVIMCINFESFAYDPLPQHSDRKFGKWTINCTAVHYQVPAGYQKNAIRWIPSYHFCHTCTYEEEEEEDKRLFQCGSQEAGLVKLDKYTWKKWAVGLGYNKNTRYKIHNKQFAIWKIKCTIKYKSHTVLEVGKGIVKEGLIFFSSRVWYWVF